MNLPANVTATVTAPVLSYSGTALINGNLNFPTGGTLTVNGSVTGSGSAGATSGTFSLVSQTGNIGAIGTPFNIGVGAGTNISLQAVSGSITVGNLLTAGAGGNGDSTGFGAQNGGNGGAVTIQAAGPVSTSSIRTFGGGGGGNMSSTSSGAGGTGGAVSLSSLSSISVTGDINSSGGGGGGNISGASPGGAAGNVTLVAGTLLTVSGPILAAGGGNGANSLAISAGGGGSFGGGGGASASNSLRAPAGGGGFYGGGGAGGLGNGFGGTGGGGGFASGGGGGGGSGGAVATPGAAGGGGGGLGQGGGGAASLGGSSGSGGGDATTNGQPGSATGMNVGLQAPGGIASQGGGTGGAGSIQPGAAGGAGGAGSPTGGGTGAAGGSGPTAGFSGGAFGVGGQGATNGSDVGSGAGGVVSINAAAISLTGTIGAASTNWPGFPSSVYAGDTINTLGTGGTISITTTASDFVSSNVAGNIRAGSTVHLQANNIGSSLLPAGAVTVISPNISAVAASFANINNTFSLSGPGTGTVTIVGNPTTTNSSAGTTFVLTVPDALMLTSSAPLTAQNVALSTGQPNASIIAGSNVTGTATVALTSPTVGTNVGATINGGSVTIANTHLSSLTISNAGTITASTGSLTASSPTSMNLNVTGGGTMNALIGGITLTATTLGATANSITFNGSQTFNGTTTLNATGPNQSVFVTAPAVVTGNNVLLLNTPFLNNQGKITGNPLILFSAAPGGGTIANSAGNIDLNSIGNLAFVGQSLAILASGSIVNSGGARTINLSTANTAPAGVLTMVAGYNFMPPTAGVVGPTATPFTLTTVGSGNVNLPTVSINTSSTAGSAGGVLVVANGFVNLGNITATAPSGLGGPVTIIGTGITTGSITTTGALGGAITLNSATPNMVTPVTVTNGIVTAGSFAPAVFGGNLILGTLNSGSGNITIATGSNGFYILGGTPTTSAVLSVMTGTTDINLFAFNAARVQLNTAANANVFSANAVGLNASTVAGNLSLTALGLLTVAGNVNAANVSLTTSGLNSGITVNSAITATAGSTPTITLSATGSVQLNGGLTANRVNVTTTGGGSNNFVLNADITGVGANSQVSLNSFTGPNLTRTFGTIAAGTVGFSFAGAVGTNANRIVTNAGTLNLVNGGPANNVFITQQNSVTLGSSGFVSAGGTLNVIVQNGNLTFQSMFAGQNISLLAQNGGAVQTVGGFVSNATGGIFVTAGGGALSLNGGFFAGGTGAGAFSAATGTSTIGPVTVNNGALTIDAINGGVSQQNFTTLSTNTGNITIITRNGDALLNGFVRSNVNGGISITANMGNITFRGLSSAQANDVNVTTSGQGSILALPNSVSSSGMNGFFRLTAKGSTGDITLSDAMISTTGVGSINLLADRNIVVGRMSSQNGSVTGTAGIVGGGSVTTGGVFSLLTTVTGSIIFTQNGAAGQISLGGDAYTFVDGGISLTAAGAGGITSRTLSAGGNGSVQITANTTAGASYTALPFSYIFTNTGNVGVGVAQNVSLQSVMAGGTVSIQAGNGTLSNAGLVSGKSVNLQSGSSATLNGMVRSNNGAVNIQTGGALLVNQSLTSSNGALNIQVNSGSFTTGQSALLAAIGGSMNISTLAPASGSVLLNGGANVLGTGNFALNITSARDLTAGQLFNVTTGNINLTANVGTLQVNNSVIGRADITILHKSIAAQDRIVLGANASVQALAPSAPQGNVVIAITNGPVTNVAGMVPTGGTVTQITSGGGQIFFGPGQFVNTGFTTLNAKGANVTFFRDAAAVDGVNAIQLNSNFIFADPPVPGAVLLPAAVQAAPVLHTGVGGAVPGALHIDSNRQANMVAPTTNVIVPAALLAPTDSTMPSTRALWSGDGVRYDEGSSAGTAANPAAATAPGSATVRFTAGVGSTTGRSVAGSSGASPACSVVDSGPGCSDSGEQTSNGGMGEGKPSGAVLPVDVFNSVLTGFVAKKAGILAGKPSYMKAASEASVKQISDSAFKLDNGEVVVSASRRSTLYSGDYAIEIAPGAIVHATRYGSVLKIRNLCDTAGNAVRLTIGDGKVSLSPGEELVVGPDLATAEAAVKSDYVGRRNARRYVIDSKRAIVKTELSIIALIQRNSLLSNMYTKGSAADHNIMDRVMKMAAALFQVTGRRGAYSAYEPTKENHPIALRSSQPQG